MCKHVANFNDSSTHKKEVKENLEKAGVNISETVRQHLEELYWKIRLKEEMEVMRKILEEVKPSERGFAEKSAREDRESH
ncbi:MAG: VapB-type antitoxin [Candidatus Bathyarchaeia archaeon]